MLIDNFWTLIFGRLSWHSLPIADMIHNPNASTIIAVLAASIVVFGTIAVGALLTYYKLWKPLWFDWLTSLDHKKIGVMYVVLAFVMLARAVIEGALMRGQQAFGLDGGFLSANHFAQLFSTHGTIMIFFMAMPFLTGLINFAMPLQIGARDVSFPLLNSISLGLTAAGAGLVMVSLVVGKFSTGGWTGYPPYTGIAYSPGVGTDYWIWAVTLASVGSTLTGMNFAVTLYKERAPGMTFFRMPLFCWTSLCVAILMVFAMPPLTAATLMLALDRYAGFHFFTNDLGGNMMNYANLFWLFGHPEVYILILPAFGVYSEVFATFSSKTLYGYKSLVVATMCIAVLSFSVWLHHFFTMGQSADVNAAFGIATMTIGIPTGVKVYDWLLTMYRGRVRLSVPMIYALGFVVLFVIGGMSGILLANPTIDYQLHNTLFLVAHFHNMVIPGVLFGMLAGYTYWFPKAFGFRLNERWGAIGAYSWIVGFMLAFFPLYILGLLGMPRRSVAFQEPAYLPWTAIAGIGAVVLLFALTSLFVQLWISIREREQNRVFVGDPWDGRTLEWSVSAPPPEYNFAWIPNVCGRDAFMEAKEDGSPYAHPARYEDIRSPKNSVLGPALMVSAGVLAFAITWHIWWLVVVSAVSIVAWVFRQGFVRDDHRVISAEIVRKETERWLASVASTPAVTRAHEFDSTNRGRSIPVALEPAA